MIQLSTEPERMNQKDEQFISGSDDNLIKAPSIQAGAREGTTTQLASVG